MGMASSMANTFFWKYDPEQQAHCDLMSSFVKGIVASVLVALMLIVPTIGPFVTADAVAAEGATVAAVETGYDAVAVDAQGLWAAARGAARAAEAARARMRPTVGDPGYLPALKAKGAWAWKANVPYNFGKNWNTYAQSPLALAPWSTFSSFPSQVRCAIFLNGVVVWWTS